MNDTATVKPGGGYVEDPDFVPNAGDMRKQFNTSGLGASGQIEETSAVFDLDKAKTAEQITRALDDDDNSVSSDRVLLSQGPADPDAERKAIHKAAKARLKKPVIVGEASPLEALAAEDGDDSPTKKGASATDGPRAEGGSSAHVTPEPPATAEAGGSAPAGSTAAKTGNGDAKKSGNGDGDDDAPGGNAGREDWAKYAKSKGAPKEETDEGGLSRNELRDKYGPKS